jgi:hypothetical protein
MGLKVEGFRVLLNENGYLNDNTASARMVLTNPLNLYTLKPYTSTPLHLYTPQPSTLNSKPIAFTNTYLPCCA